MDINLPLSPPVNNNIQISLNDRLDAIVFEKIRVANTQLDTRLTLQEKIINKYRRDVEKVHAHQTQRLRREVKKIRQKKPDYVFDDSDLSTSRSRYTTETGRQRCLSEPSNLSYCRRYYAHHYNVKDTSRDEKKEKEEKKKGENDFFNLKLRLYFINTMKNAYQKVHLEHDTPAELHKSNDESDPGESFGRGRRQFTRATSTDDGNDDVFANSCNSFKTVQDLTEYKIQEGDESALLENEIDGKHHRSETCYSSAKGNETSDDLGVVSVNNRKGRRRHRDRKRKPRNSIIGSGSEAEIEFNEAERRKSKHAFEKIFAGLL